MKKSGYVLATVHRQENTDYPDRLEAILKGLQTIAREIPVILPLHPRTKGAIRRTGLEEALKGLTITEPLGYLDMVALERSAAVIATDSGGVQKEAFFHGVPCVTLRDETEWMELVEAGWNRLASPTDPEKVAKSIKSAIGATGAAIFPYGDGNSAQIIAKSLKDFLT